MTQPPSRNNVPAPDAGALEQRLDEIRGLVRIPGLEEVTDLSRPESLVALSFNLANVLEKTQRQLIESNIQLISLREVAHNLLSIQTPDRAAETIALYLHKAFDYERVAVLLLERQRHRLSGRLVARETGRLRNDPMNLPLIGAGGALVESFLRGEPRLMNEPARTALFSDSLGDGFDPRRLNSCLVVPLRAGKARTPCFQQTGCGNTACPVFGRESGEACWLRPEVDCRHENRFGQEPRRATCLTCSVFPMLGVILVGRSDPAPALSASDLLLLDSVGGTMATIVENARLYAELRDEELFRNDILNSMGSGLVAVDLEGRAISLNVTAARMTGFDQAEVMGVVPPFFNTGDKGLEAALRGSLAGTPVLRRESRLLRRGGTIFPASVSTAPLRNAAGEVYGAIATFLDLTELKQMEERIHQLDRLAVLGRFTAGIAHEIRNPLTGISTGVQYLTKGMGREDPQFENVGFILNEIQRLNRIVEDLFRVTHPHPLMTTLEDLGRLVDRSLQSLGNLAEEGNIRVEREYAAGLPRVPFDADQMQQVAINLIKNAIEATPKGGAVRLVTSQRPGRRGEAGWAVFKVVDTGSGMNPEVQKKIFEPFFTRKKQGTGLGLYITHGIVERHGGHMRVESQEGAGSTFTVELPLQPILQGGAS
jgi:PAS domain S-box-containing protein